MADGRVLEGMAYKDYVALLCYLDESLGSCEKSKDRVKGLDGQCQRMATDFTNGCWRYRDGIESYRDDYNRANKGSGDTSGTDDKVPSYLYNPLYCLSFGQYTMLGIVLLDSLDPLTSITSEVKSPIRRACLAFCPELDSLGLSDNPHLFEFHQLLEGEAPSCYIEKPSRPRTRSFETERPLVVLTRYKMSGVTVLGQGLLTQQALFKAMAKKITEVLRVPEKGRLAPEDRRAFFSSTDAAELRCTLLDLQGAEEIGSLIYCRNYSTAVALIAAFRSLTLGDLFEQDSALETLFARSEMHRLLYGGGVRGETPPVRTGKCPWRDNHIFCSTHTTLGATVPAFLDDGLDHCHGVLQAYAQLNVRPGHDSFAEKKLRKIMRRAGTPTEARTPPPASASRWMLLGRNDCLVQHASGADQPFAVTETKELLKGTRRLADELIAEQAREADNEEPEANSVTTLVLVPFPDDGLPHKVGSLHKSVGEQLRVTCCRLLRAGSGGKWRTCECKAPSTGWDMDRLEDSMRALQIPRSLARSIAYLYQDFLNCLAESRRFEGCLDMYDMFATLYAVLTEHLPAEQNRRSPLQHERALFFDGRKVRELSRLVDGIHNALMHRINVSVPDAEVWDMAVDYRGGLNQIVAAADVPSKVGLGVLKRIMDGTPRQPNLVGGITTLRFDPRTVFYQFDLCEASKACLIRLQTNVRHILDPADLVELMHETAHAIFAFLTCAPPDKNGGTDVSPALRTRRDEIFASILSHLFVFEDDIDLFLRHSICSYSRSAESIETDPRFFEDAFGADSSDAKDIALVVRFTEFLLRVFLVSDRLRYWKENGRKALEWPQEYELREGTPDGLAGKGVPEGIVRRFRKMVEDFGPFFSEFERLFPADGAGPNWKLCEVRFRESYEQTLPHMKSLWRKAVEVHTQCTTMVGLNRGDFAHRWADILNQMSVQLNSGRPFVRASYLASGLKQEDVDCLFTVCALFREHIRKLYGTLDPGKRIHIYREPSTGEVQFTRTLGRDPRPWNVFQIDRAYGTLFCVSPTARLERLRHQISVIKSLWDISTSLRARRLEELLRETGAGWQ